MLRLVVLGSLALGTLALGCTSTDPASQPPVKPVEEGKAEPEPEPEPVPQPTARAVIASVQLIEDCPSEDEPWRAPPVERSDSAPSEEPGPAAAMPASPPSGAQGKVAAGSRLAGDAGGNWQQPCTQSTVQVVFTSLADAPAKVEIEAVRLLDPKTGKKVALLQTRKPAAWSGEGYQAWDETLGAKQEAKASYLLSVPDWSAVNAAMGVSDSFGTMFLLELDVKIGDERQSVRSTEFPREAPHVIVT